MNQLGAGGGASSQGPITIPHTPTIAPPAPPKAAAPQVDLSAADVSEYNAAEFTFGNIPEAPPPASLCR